MQYAKLIEMLTKNIDIGRKKSSRTHQAMKYEIAQRLHLVVTNITITATKLINKNFL